MKKLWHLFLNKIGYAYVISEIEQDKLIITLYSNGWVNISDGNSNDMLPLMLCSDELVQKFKDKIDEDES